jgi:hypothetical protein
VGETKAGFEPVLSKAFSGIFHLFVYYFVLPFAKTAFTPIRNKTMKKDSNYILLQGSAWSETKELR